MKTKLPKPRVMFTDSKNLECSASFIGNNKKFGAGLDITLAVIPCATAKEARALIAKLTTPDKPKKRKRDTIIIGNYLYLRKGNRVKKGDEWRDGGRKGKGPWVPARLIGNYIAGSLSNDYRRPINRKDSK